MVPLVHTREEAERAVSYCKFPPQGRRSVAYPVRAVYKKGVGPEALGRYLRDANGETEVGGLDAGGGGGRAAGVERLG
jgi:2-keto-3-deoxy-L-rhamnonate aldolase RhmA